MSKSDRLPSEWRADLPKVVYEIEKEIIAGMGSLLPGRAPKGILSWKHRVIAPGFLLLIETASRELVAGEVMAVDGAFVRLRDTSPASDEGGQSSKEPDEDLVIRWTDVWRIVTLATPDHNSTLFWRRVANARKKWANPFDRCPFETRLKVLHACGTAKVHVDAAVHVNDTLDTARAIAKAQFGSDVRPDAVMEVYRALCEHEAALQEPQAKGARKGPR